MKTLDVVTLILLVVGGLNWGLWGAAKVDLVAALLGEYTVLARLVYVVVGLAALYQAVQWRSSHNRWKLQAGQSAV